MKNRLKLNQGVIVLSVFISLVLSFTIYLLFLQTPLFSKREVVVAFLILAGLIWTIYLVLDRFLFPRFNNFSRRKKWGLILISSLFGLLIVITTNQPPLYAILPAHIFQIEIPSMDNQTGATREVTITWITSDLGDLSFSQLIKTGGWEISDSGITHSGPDSASLTWEGKTGHNLIFELKKTRYSNPLVIFFDQKQSLVDLAGAKDESITISQVFNPREGHHLLISILLWFAVSLLFFLVTFVFLTLEIQSGASLERRKFSWLLYSIPMIIVWGVYLLTFFPGMMSPDSNDQLLQAINGKFIDLHPVFHTLYMWSILKIWYSPAAVAIFQIIFMSITFAWGISILDRQGFPTWGSWGLASIVSLAPINGDMVIILWKDIPYSICVLLFSLIVLEIVFSNGLWLDKKTSWIVLGLTSLCVASFRHNGLPIPIIILPLLIFLYKNQRKPLLQALGLAVTIYAIINGPVFTYLNVNRATGDKQLTFIQHIAAHIATGENLTQSEAKLASEILPLDEWKYNCCQNYDLYKSPSYSPERLTKNVPNIQNLFIDLALKEPGLEIDHMVCSSSLVWGLPGKCGSTTFLPYTSSIWIDPGKNLFQENSLLPRLVPFLSNLLLSIRTNPNLTILIAPAVYLLLGIYNTAILSFRKKDVKIFLFIVPAIIQSITLALLVVSSEYRYQFGVYMIGLFSIGFLILALHAPNSKIKIEEAEK
jgi:hypothetical protein